MRTPMNLRPDEDEYVRTVTFTIRKIIQNYLHNCKKKTCILLQIILSC